MRRVLVRIAPMWALALTLFAIPAALVAQATGTVRGTVTDAATQLPLADAQIQVIGAPVAAITNQAGQFTMTLVPAGARQIRVRRIGYERMDQTANVTAGTETTLNFAMRPSVNQLDALVVTGTAGAVEKRTLGNAITQVDVADLTDKATIMNVTEALQARTPGLTLMPGSGTVGAAAELRIRGAGSLTGYKPVVYIDGIRYNIEALGNFNPTGAGISAQSTQVTSALDLINPNDIESIEVIKGPAAATLYGADASTGVIQIITKKGNRGQQRTRWQSKFEIGNEEWAVKPASNYLMCDNARMAATVNLGTAAAPNLVPTYPGCAGPTTATTDDQPVGTVVVANPLFDDPATLRAQSPGITGTFSDERPLRTGYVRRGGLSFRGGGDRYGFYVAGDRDLVNGVFHNNFSSRTSGRGNFTLTPTNNSDIALNVSYIQTHLRLPISDESGNALTLSGARWQPGRRNIGTLSPGWATIDPIRANAYDNRTQSDRLTLGATVNYRPVNWFSNRFVAGVDRTAAEATILSLPGSTDTPAGFIAIQRPETYVYTLDYAGNVTYDVSPSIATTTSVGAQVISNQSENLRATGTGLGAPDVTLVNTATTVSGLNSFSEFNSVGYYVQEQIGWNNRLFVTAAVRADDHSSFGTDFDIIVYPKLSLSYVASEEPALRSLFDNLRADNFKFRTAWGQAGRAPAPYSATQTYSIDRVTVGTATANALRTSTFGNPDLKPEKGTEIEIGFDAAFLQNRFGTELTYYNKKTTDMLVAVSVAPSSGFVGTRTTNLGSVKNTGLEVGLTATPLQAANAIWDARLNIATNKNVLLDIPDTSRRASITGQAYGITQQNREGFPLGGYWASFPQLDGNGVPIVNAAGAVQMRPDTVYMGPATPTRELSFSNTLTLMRNWRVYVLFDHKGGHYLFNQRLRNQCQAANDICSLNNADGLLGARNITATAPGTAADSVLWRHLQYRRFTTPATLFVQEEWIEKADFVKLREISLTYTLPSVWATRLRASGANVTVAGRNLATWSDYRGADPEVNSYGGRLFARADTYTVPNLRRFTATLNLSF